MTTITRAAFSLLVLFSLIASPSVFGDEESGKATAPANDKSLRVMTFNIRYDNPHDGDNIWPNRRKMVASMIRLHGADFAGLQEVQPAQMHDLKQLLPEWKWMGLRVSGKGDGERVPILYRPERFELLEEGHFGLSETPEEPGRKGWDAALPRLAVWGKFRDRRTEEEIFVFNTHFDHVGKQARLESAKLLKSQGEALAGDRPTMVMGDMNCRDTDEPYAVFIGQEPSPEDPSAWRLYDAKNVSLHPHHGPTSTFQGFGKLPPNRRIDYIFVTPAVKVLQHATLADRWDDGRWPSDHLPVLAEVRVEK